MSKISEFASALKEKYYSKKAKMEKRNKLNKQKMDADKEAVKKGTPSIAEKYNFGGKYKK